MNHPEPPTTPQAPVHANLASLPLERLEREICELAAHIHAATCRWLGLVAELDRREGHTEWGFRSCAEWLSWRCGVGPLAAREQVRVARRLGELPLLCERFARGELSYSKVRAVSRVAVAANEAELVELARHATAAQLERLVRGYRSAALAESARANRAHEERYLTWRWEDDGSLIVRGHLPAEDGALVLNALQAARDQLREGAGRRSPADPGVSAETPAIPRVSAETGATAGTNGRSPGGAPSVSAETSAPAAGGAETDPSADEPPARPAASNADALVLMAETLLANGSGQRSGGERYQIVLHTGATALRDQLPEGRCELDAGQALPAQTARRLACDASLVRIIEREGGPLSVGRKTRSIPAALRRALDSRDGGCRFPGCGQRRFVDAHHIDHWADGGETKLSNLLQLCRHHHRLVHEGGYRVERHPHRGVVFRRPDGRPIPAIPKPHRGDHRELIRRSRRLNPQIGPETCSSLSGGDRLDYHLAVWGLMARAGPWDGDQPGRRQGVPGATRPT